MTTSADLETAVDLEPSAEVDVHPIRAIPWYLRIYLLWGKVRRWYLARFRPEYVRRSLARRRGECRHSGACCHIAFSCPKHGPTDHGTPGCTIYETRPQNCRVFPIDERDITDRDIMMPDHACGFFFISEEQAAAEASVGAWADGRFQV